MNEKLMSPFEEKCLGNPQGFHVAVSNGTICVYCGNPVKSQNYKPHAKYGVNCKTRPQECIACNEAKQRDKSHGGKLVSAASSQPIHQCLDGSQNTGFRHQEAKLPQEYRQER